MTQCCSAETDEQRNWLPNHRYWAVLSGCMPVTKQQSKMQLVSTTNLAIPNRLHTCIIQVLTHCDFQPISDPHQVGRSSAYPFEHNSPTLPTIDHGLTSLTTLTLVECGEPFNAIANTYFLTNDIHILPAKQLKLTHKS